MALIVHGSKLVAIKEEEFLIKCPCCEAHTWADILVVSKYVHVYWVPLWAVEKQANVICQKCGLKRYGMAFDSDLIDNYQEVKHQFKHPWFTYTGLALVTGFFLFIIISILNK